jgi:hypothetical protein
MRREHHPSGAASAHTGRVLPRTLWLPLAHAVAGANCTGCEKLLPLVCRYRKALLYVPRVDPRPYPYPSFISQWPRYRECVMKPRPPWASFLFACEIGGEGAAVRLIRGLQLPTARGPTTVSQGASACKMWLLLPPLHVLTPPPTSDQNS